MRFRLLLLTLLLGPSTLPAQHNCDLAVTYGGVGNPPRHTGCVPQDPAHFIADPRLPDSLTAEDFDPSYFSYNGVAVLLLIDTAGVPARIEIPSYRHLAPRALKELSDLALAWRFRPARRNGRSVMVDDSVVLVPAIPSIHHPPRPCLDCDGRRPTTRWSLHPPAHGDPNCAIADSILTTGRIDFANDWIPAFIPNCPEAGASVARFYSAHPFPTRGRALIDLLTGVRRPEVVRALMQRAREGELRAMRLLALEASNGYERIRDSVPQRWDAEHSRPANNCGAIHFYLPVAERRDPPLGPRTRIRIRAFADSIVAQGDAPPALRAGAWCLAAQLR